MKSDRIIPGLMLPLNNLRAFDLIIHEPVDVYSYKLPLLELLNRTIEY